MKIAPTWLDHWGLNETRYIEHLAGTLTGTVHSLNVSCCLYYYPTHITVPSPNTTHPDTAVFSAPLRKFSLLLLINQIPLDPSRPNNHWHFPKDFSWYPNPQEPLSLFPLLSPGPRHTMQVFFISSRLKEHEALGFSFPSVRGSHNPLLPSCRMKRCKVLRHTHHSMCPGAYTFRVSWVILPGAPGQLIFLFHGHLDQCMCFYKQTYSIQRT